MDDLVTWLRAQLDEDENLARESFGDHNWDRARALVDVEAKRRLLDWLVDLEGKALDGDWWNIEVSDAVELLALPYADQPGYDESWRP